MQIFICKIQKGFYCHLKQPELQIVYLCNMQKLRVAVIGGGASGFMGAISCAELNPDAEVIIFEKTSKFLSKVRVSGGGRCNVTHACFENSKLIKYYPRGERFLKVLFSRFSSNDTVNWFAERGVELKAEEDGRMFPVTDSSLTIIDCLIAEARKHKVVFRPNTGVSRIVPLENGKLKLDLGNDGAEEFDRVLIATGGNPNASGYKWLEELGHSIKPPLPSLFTFNVPDAGGIKVLAGVSVANATVKIRQSNLSFSGPLLITHWGFSGPAILKLSAWGAEWLAGRNYNCEFAIQWHVDFGEDACREFLFKYKEENPKKLVLVHNLFQIPSRLWEMLVTKATIPADMKWLDMSKKLMNKLVEELVRSTYKMNGKTTFKEEFVTCGGVELEEINPRTMESLKVPGLYFGGEVIDIDGITGGFNFQNAWSTGWVAGRAMSKAK